MKILLSTLNAKYIHSSLALRYLKAYSAEKGIKCQIEEYTINMTVLDIVGAIMEHNPKVVGFACYIWNIAMTLRVGRMLKTINPDIILVFGGPEVSYTARDIMADHPYIDFIVQGEGEECFAALMDSLKHKKEVTIPGILQRCGDKVIGSETVVEVKDLSTIPFPYTDEDMVELSNKIVYYESSRGCPFSCQYCLSGNKNTVRFFPLARTLSELKWFMKHGVKQVKFVDRTFNCSKSHHLPIMELIKNSDTRTNFHMEMEADLLGPEEIDLLTTASKGRMQIEIGVQSTNKKTLAAIHRYNNWEHIKNLTSPIIKAGRTHVHMDLIVGLPYETYELFQESFNDVFSLEPQALQIGFLKMLKGAGIRSMNEHQYIHDLDAPYEVLGNAYLPYEKVRFLSLFEDVFERYYNSEKFPHLFRFLCERWKENNLSAFLAFEKLVKAWQQRGYHKIKLNDKAQVLFLYESLSLLWKADIEVLEDLLRIDVLLTYGGKLKPEEIGFIPISLETRQASEAFWRNEELVKRYIPDYEFKEWSSIRRHYQELHIAVETKEWLNLESNHLIINVTGEQFMFTRPDSTTVI